jgi:hypothetical protein
MEHPFKVAAVELNRHTAADGHLMGRIDHMGHHPLTHQQRLKILHLLTGAKRCNSNGSIPTHRKYPPDLSFGPDFPGLATVQTLLPLPYTILMKRKKGEEEKS